MNYKIFFSAFLVLSSVFAKAQNDISLNGKWQFQTDSADVGEKQGWFSEENPAFSDELVIPGNWNTENRYTSYTGTAWYKKEVFIPSTLNGRLIRLYFEGVYNKAKVWVNGTFVIDNNLGYLKFEHDISALLHYGKTNTIVVLADNRFKLGALWNWGGIRRPVKLLINNPVYIKQNHVTPQVNLTQRTAGITFKLLLSNTSQRDVSISGKVDVYRKGILLESIPFKNIIKANAIAEQLLKANVGPKEFWLWNLDDPNLYHYKVVLYKGRLAIDEVAGRFGLRVIELDNARKQLRLNCKVIRPIGFNLAPDDRTTGNTLPLWRVKEDVDIMKSLGAGFARMSHAPFHDELLDYLDEKGILIFEEIPIWGDNNSMVKSENLVTNEWLTRMITDHYNHPCIAGWSVANEIGKNKEAMAYTANSIQLVKKLDPTRLGVTVSYTAQNGEDPLQLSDLGFMNSYGRVSGSKVNKVHSMHPGSTLFLAEFGWAQLNEDLATDFPIQSMMDSLTMKPFLIGASLWTFNDYRSTFKDTKEHSQNRPWGLVDVSRQKKRAFYSFREANKPVKSLQVTASEFDKTLNKYNATLNIIPRAVFDLPAYELENFRVVLKLVDKNGALVGGNFKTLPVIKPGDEAFNISLSTKELTLAPAKAYISLVSQQNYVVYDTVIYFQKPSNPKVLYVGKGAYQSGQQELVQIRFEKDGSATSYKVRYLESGQRKETSPTTNNYINVTGVNFSNFISPEVVAVNNFGETVSLLTPIISNKKLLPPLIRFTEPADGGFFTGVETVKDDIRFIVQVTQKAGDYRQALTTVAETKGVFKVSGLANGKDYYYKVKRENADGVQSDWSEEIEVKSDGGLPPVMPRIQGILKTEK